jgi:RNA polymerase sigma-70 factor (ECF subfamily)
MDETKAIAHLKAGDIAGLRALVEMYQVEAVQAASLITGDRAAAEDIVQAAFLRTFQRIQGFDEARPFRPWFLRMVVNEAVKTAARQRRRVSLEEGEDVDYAAALQRLDTTTREPEEAIQRKELVEEMQVALERLSPAQRAAVVMHYFLDLSTAEAAERLNCAPGTLRWHLSVARERLRTLLAAFK